MNIEIFKQLNAYEQEVVLLLTKVVKALESIAREDGE